MLLNLRPVPRFIFFAGLCLVIATVARADELRTWTDSTGRFDLQAKFISVEDGVVNLVRENGEKTAIALDKLSKADQEYVANLKAESPFKAADDSPFMSVQPKPQPSREGPRNVTVDWSGSQIIALDATGSNWNATSPAADASGSVWSITPPAAGASDFRAKSVGLPKKTDFFEKLAGVAVNTVAKKAVVGYTLAKHGSKATTRIVMCDLERGRTVASAATDGQMTPLALHDNGTHVLMRRNEFGFGNSDRLEIWSIQGTDVIRSLIWTPYDNVGGGARDVTWAEFIDSETLVTASGGGKVALWDVASAQPICHFETVSGAVPAMSDDRKWIAFCGKDRMGLFDIEKREMAVVQDTPVALMWPYMAFSPSGQKIGCIAFNRILVWDTASGQLQKNFATPGIHIHGAIDFPDDGFILAANQFLIALDTQLKLWHYQGAVHAQTIGGTTFLAAAGMNGPDTLAAAKLPHPAAVSLLEKVAQRTDLFIFHKGAPVSLNVEGIPSDERKRVTDALTKKLEQMECPIRPDAPIELVASVEGPKQKTIRLMNSGEYKVKEYHTWAKFVYQGKPLWTSSATNLPGIYIRLKKGENIEGVLRKASKQPAYGFYDGLVLPEFLQKPAENGAGQTLGACQVTPMGFR